MWGNCVRNDRSPAGNGERPKKASRGIGQASRNSTGPVSPMHPGRDWIVARRPYGYPMSRTMCWPCVRGTMYFARWSRTRLAVENAILHGSRKSLTQEILAR